MPDPENIPHLIKLLDDESSVVLEEVSKALLEFGPALRDHLERMPVELNPAQKKSLSEILERHNRQWLKEAWSSWYYIKEDLVRLEAALELLALFQSGLPPKIPLKEQLDQLASEFSSTHIKKDSYGLAYFLFEVKCFKGSQADYYNPRNSNLLYVIEAKTGIPISLACLYILVAARLGFAVEGCNYPGHFLARIEINDRIVFVDCFSGGRIVTEDEIRSMQEEGTAVPEETLRENASPETIVSRVLGNLISAYDHAGNLENSQLMFELLNALELSHLKTKSAS